MLITIEKKEFIQAVHKIIHFTQRNTVSLPILSCVIIVAGDDGIKFRANNLEIAADLKIPGKITTNGIVAIPVGILQQITTTLNINGVVVLEQIGDTVLITSDYIKSTIKTISQEDFPNIPTPQNKQIISLDAKILSSIINTTISCASTSNIRPELASIFFTFTQNSITTVATDSFRLVEKIIPISLKITENFSFLVPAKNISEIIKIIPQTINIILHIDEHQLVIKWDENIITTRLTGGTYPDYKQLIPKQTIKKAIVLKKDFDTLLKHISIFSDSFQKTTLLFNPDNQTLSLSSHNNDLGSSIGSIPAEISGDQIELSFNYHYLQTPLSLITTENISLNVNNIGQPLVIHGIGDNTFLYLVMPMNQ